MADVLYQASQGLIGEDLVVTYEVRRVPRGNKQVFLTPANGKDTINLNDPNEEIDVMWLGFDKAAAHNAVVVRNGVPIEASRSTTYILPENGRYAFTAAVFANLGIVGGDMVQYFTDGILSNPLLVV